MPISSEDYNTANEPINTRSLLHRTSAFFNQQRTKSNFKLFYLLEILLRSLDTGPQIFLLLGLLKGKKHDANYHIHVMMPNLKEFCQMVPWTHENWNKQLWNIYFHGLKRIYQVGKVKPRVKALVTLKFGPILFVIVRFS